MNNQLILVILKWHLGIKLHQDFKNLIKEELINYLSVRIKEIFLKETNCRDLNLKYLKN